MPARWALYRFDGGTRRSTLILRRDREVLQQEHVETPTVSMRQVGRAKGGRALTVTAAAIVVSRNLFHQAGTADPAGGDGDA